MPPLAVVGLEAVSHHRSLQYHAVVILLLVDGFVGTNLLSRKDVGM